MAVSASLFPISCQDFKICIITHFNKLFFPYGVAGCGLSEEQIAQIRRQTHTAERCTSCLMLRNGSVCVSGDIDY